MIVEELHAPHVVLTALYLRGAPRPYSPPRRCWRGVLRAMRERPEPLGKAGDALRQTGWWEEASVLESRGLLAWAEERCAQVLTPVCDRYPKRWLHLLGDAAPPALWCRGTPSALPYIGVVGSRVVSPDVAGFAEEAGRWVVREGRALISGGAEGCDTFGARGAKGEGGDVTRVLPCGLDAVAPVEACDLSACAPGEPFSTGAAMERNALIYAAAEATLVVHARFRVGGTWHGATDALRRRLGRILVRDEILVREESTAPAHRALIALGGIPLRTPSQLADALVVPPAQASLFPAA